MSRLASKVRPMVKKKTTIGDIVKKVVIALVAAGFVYLIVMMVINRRYTNP